MDNNKTETEPELVPTIAALDALTDDEIDELVERHEAGDVGELGTHEDNPSEFGFESRFSFREHTVIIFTETERKRRYLSLANEPLKRSLSFDLGTFEGFNFRDQCAIAKILTGNEVLNWNHDGDGEAEFWPSGDNPEVALLFKHKSRVTASELELLDQALEALGDDSTESYARIYHAMTVYGAKLESLTSGDLRELDIYIFRGTSFLDLRKEAAYELFETFYPEEYAIWERSHCDGLIFDTDHFLDSPSFYCDEIQLGDEKILLVAPQ